MPDDGYNYFSEYVFVRLHILYIDLECIMQKMTDEFTKNWQLLSESSRIINLDYYDNVIIRKSKAIHNEKIEHLVIIRHDGNIKINTDTSKI